MMVFSSVVLLDTTFRNFDTYYAVGQFDLRATSGSLRPIDDLQNEVKKIRGVTAVQGALAGVVTLPRANGAMPPSQIMTIVHCSSLSPSL